MRWWSLIKIRMVSTSYSRVICVIKAHTTTSKRALACLSRCTVSTFMDCQREPIDLHWKTQTMDFPIGYTTWMYSSTLPTTNRASMVRFHILQLTVILSMRQLCGWMQLRHMLTYFCLTRYSSMTRRLIRRKGGLGGVRYREGTRYGSARVEPWSFSYLEFQTRTATAQNNR
jgi:hypothetical protein